MDAGRSDGDAVATAPTEAKRTRGKRLSNSKKVELVLPKDIDKGGVRHVRDCDKPKVEGQAAHDDPWDISRINKHWEIDAGLRRNLPALARARRGANETAAGKFLRLTKLPCPTPADAEPIVTEQSTSIHVPIRAQSRKSVVMTPDVKAKYFGNAAKADCYAIFRRLASQKYLTNAPLHEFLGDQHLQNPDRKDVADYDDDDDDYDEEEEEPKVTSSSANNAIVPPIPLNKQASDLVDVSLHPVDRRGLFSRQFTARHKFSSLCLDRDLPPCIRLIIRNYFAPEINVSHMAIGDDLGCVFAECLLDLPMVTGLNVRNNRLRDKGLQAIIDAIISKKDMHYIDLSENKVDGDAAASLAAYLGSAKCSLQSIKLSHADVDDGELVAFTKALHSNKSLQTLDVSNNLVGSSESLNVVRPSITTGGEALATMLSINQTLTCLDLSWNYLRLGGAIELGKALAYNTGLCELNLSYNAFGNAGAQAIGESLLSNSSLTKLNLSHNNIPAQGALTIANALKSNVPLVSLQMDGNPLGQTGGRAMLHAVAACTEKHLAITMEGCNFDLSETDAFDPTEATGSYDLNMEIPYERAIALELLRVANSKQGCKFLSVVHISGGGKVKRNIKVELREVDNTDARRRLLKTAGILTDATTNDEALRGYKLDRESLETVFRELDVDDSGFIDDIELREGLKKLNLPFRDEDIPRYVALYDVDGTGTIELEEFVELISSFNLETDHFPRQCVDIDTNRPFEIPMEGRLLIDFADFHVSGEQDNAHSHVGVERLIENIKASKNKGQILGMAKSGLYFRVNEAQLLLESVSDSLEISQAVMLLLPNMVDPKNAYSLIDQNLDMNQRLRVQHMMGQALQPLLGYASGHYKLDLSVDMDRATVKKLVENSNRTAFLRKKAGQKDTSQHGNYHGFRNETLNGKPFVLEPLFLDSMPKFGTVEFDYVQMGRQHAHHISTKRLEQVIQACQLDLMGPAMGVRTSTVSSSTDAAGAAMSKQGAHQSSPLGSHSETTEPASTPSPFPPRRYHTRSMFNELESMKTTINYLKFGEGLNRTIQLKQPDTSVVDNSADEDDADDLAVADSPEVVDELEAPRTPVRRVSTARETCTARRLLFNLQWCLATHWITAQHAIRLLSLWPEALANSRCEVICLLFDRVVDLHNFSAIMSALNDAEAAQCLYRLGWLNLWTPLLPDDYYELSLALYEEREVAKALVRLAIDEPGENWQDETFGWTRDEPIPGWELNMTWLKDGGFPEKGFLALEYYSGADKGCGPVWPTRRELAAGTLCGLPDDVDDFVLYVDSLSMLSPAQRRSRDK